MMSNPATQIVTARNRRTAGNVTVPDVRAERREPIDGAQHEVRGPRKPFAERIDQEQYRRDRQQLHAEGIEHPRRDEQQRQPRAGCPQHDRGRERAAGERAASRARVACVDLAVEEAIRRHRRRARAQHRERDPYELRRRRNSPRREHRADVRKGQRKEGVLDANLAQEESDRLHGSRSATERSNRS
jgi:hypothetical protein